MIEGAERENRLPKTAYRRATALTPAWASRWAPAEKAHRLKS